MSEKNNRTKEDCCLKMPEYMIREFLILSPLYWPKLNSSLIAESGTSSNW